MLSFKQTNLGLCPRRTTEYFTRNKVYPVIGLHVDGGVAIKVVVVDDEDDRHQLTDDYIKTNFDWVLTS